MADIKHCEQLTRHLPHMWEEEVSTAGESGTAYHRCNGARTQAPALHGATNEPAPEYRTANAGEFAAKWNTMTPEEREAAWQRIEQMSHEAQKCFMEDHAGAVNQLQSILEYRAQLHSQPLRDAIENLLADELYDGGMGYIGDKQFIEYRRNLADKVDELVGERMSNEHTVNILRSDWERLKQQADTSEQGEPLPKETQWYAYWTGVHQAVQHWADGTEMACPYDTPKEVIKDLVVHLLDEGQE